MSLNSIRLTPAMLVDLYAFSLVENIGNQGKSAPAIPHAGARDSAILVVARSHADVHLTDEEQVFLKSIMGACKISLADVAVVNWKAAGETGALILEQFVASRVLLFGIDPVLFGLPLHFPPFQIQDFNKRTYLFAPPLSDLATDIPLKKQLWEALKRLFQL